MAQQKKVSGTPSSKAASKKYGDFLRTIQLSGLGLDSASVAIDRNALAEAQSQGVTVNQEMKVNLKLIHQSEHQFIVGVDCDLLLRAFSQLV